MTSTEGGRELAAGAGGDEDPVQRILRLGLPRPMNESSPSVLAAAEPTVAGPALEPGRVIGDYRLVALLGQGGMAQVWEAEQLSLGGRRVALKFVRPERVSARALELFAREARAGGRLSHPGIVTVHGHGTADGLAWLALELVEGGRTLNHLLEEARQAPELPPGHDRLVARLVADVAEAMHVAHQAGVIHRDLKPHNVLLAPGERPKVTDFGLARITDEAQLSVSGDVAGTFAYMSPEQVAAQRRRIDHRTDVFSLGVVLYELLVLRRPFEGDTVHQIAAQIVTREPADPRTIRSRAPRDLAVIAMRALEKQPEKRFPSCAELAADLRRFLANEPICARPPTRLDRLVKWTRRNPVKAVAGAIAGCAFVVISALLAANVRANRALAAKTAEAEERRKEAEAQRTAALVAAEAERERADEVLRLSALQDLEDRVAEADLLWPAHPENVDPYRRWLEKSARLLESLPVHEAKLAELRARVPPGHAKTQGPDGLVLDEGFGELAETLATQRDRDLSDPRDSQVRWWCNQLEKLVADLKAFEDEETGLCSAGISPEHGWGVVRRLEFARTIDERSRSGAQAAATWSAAIASIATLEECPSYAGLRIVPQIGLLPIGRDPESGLWEFAHLQTGEPAVRGPDGKLALAESTGLVFVLIPGGTFQMGAQASDPDAPNHDPRAASEERPVHEMTLAPFFLSKYELTQGQWSRCAGANPSNYGPGVGFGGKQATLLHPVEQVSWTACTETLGRLGLELPTEAQWEYAARAGTTSVWWTGDEKESLEGAANLADAFCRRNGGPSGSFYEPWDDGYTVHAPVGSYQANDFGLHDVVGNVAEWCRDAYHGYGTPPRTGDGLREPAGVATRVARGGCFFNAATQARSAYRTAGSPSAADTVLGVRPARLVAP